MKKYEIAPGVEVPVVGTVKTKDGAVVPLVDIKWMSDERWQELCAELAVKQYTEEFGHAPEDTKAALDWNRKRLEILSSN